jgi:hypothetical protein
LFHKLGETLTMMVLVKPHGFKYKLSTRVDQLIILLVLEFGAWF